MKRAPHLRKWWWVLGLGLSCAALVLGLVVLRGGAQTLFRELDPQNANGVCFDGREVRLPCDFALVYYPQGVSLRSGTAAVRGFYYTPFFAVGMRLLAHLPFALARAVWFSIVALGVGGLVWLPLLLGVITTRRTAFAYVLVLATSLPLLHDLLYGQVSSILLALAGASFWAYQRKRPALAAVLLGLASAIKFYPALFAVYYLARRDLRAALYFLGTLLVSVALIPWLVLGGHGYLALVSSIARNLSQLQRYLAGTPYSNSAVTVVAQAAQLWLGVGPVAHVMAVTLAAFVALALFALVVRAAGRDDPVAAFLLVLSALPFVVRSCWVHYFVFLPLLQAYVLGMSRTESASAPLRWSGLVGALISATVVCLPYFSLVGDADSYYRAGFPFWATLALLPALGLGQFTIRGRVVHNSSG